MIKEISYIEDGRKVKIIHYNGLDIYYNYYGENEYTIINDKEEKWYKTLEEIIESENDYE